MDPFRDAGMSLTPLEGGWSGETFLAERHASLQNNPRILDDLRERLRQMQAQGLGAIRGPEPSREAAGRDVRRPDRPDDTTVG